MDDQTGEGGFTRRKALQSSLVVGAAVGIGGLAACGGSSNSSSGTTSTATGAAAGKRKHGGTVRIAVNGSSSSTVDAHIGSASDSASEFYVGALYDTLTKFDHQFKVQNHLAQELTPSKDLKTWTVKLRAGVTFHDGKPLTADDVIFTLKRILDPKNGTSGAFIIGSIDPHKLKKIDNLTVQIGLKYPDISLPGGLAKVVQGIVPTNYNPKKPVGTGPFKLVSFNPTQRVVFARNPNYWNNPLPYADQLVFVAFTDAGAITNALTSNAVDGAGTLSAQQAATLKQNPNINVLVSKSGEFDPIVMRTDTGEFADPRVRLAMKLMIDRNQFVEQVYSGNQYGRIGNDMFTYPEDPLYASSIPQRTQDLEKAKSLLKAAGKEGLSATYVVRTDWPFLLPAAQVFQQQAKKIGVNIKLNVITDAGKYYSKYYGKPSLTEDYYYTNPFYTDAGLAVFKDSPYNTMHWNNAKQDALLTKARGEADETKRKDLATQAQQIFHDEGGWITWGYSSTVNAMNKKFTGMVDDLGGNGINNGYFDELGLA